MRTAFYILLFSCLATAQAGATILMVGSGQTYATVEAASAVALPGDTIMVATGTHSGGEHISNLQGTAGAWITILAETPGNTFYNGGNNAWQFSDAAYVRISGFIFMNQTANGVNIDDAGTFSTPTHHIIIEGCEFRPLNASGNNDQLKLSGLDSFIVRNCWFVDGSPGGSCIDMVGCHDGIIENNYFVDAGSNSIQAKGGTSDILIQRNSFLEGGARGINIGGSTGLQYFRPQGATYEATRIAVHCNVFQGCEAPVAYVGAVNCEVVNNTFVLPDKWIMRILQETTSAGFQACGNNSFINNVIYLDSQAASPSVNIGPNTAPQTFAFEHNLWYNADNSSWGGPNLPVTEVNPVMNQDPMFLDLNMGDYFVTGTSPAIGAGKSVSSPTHDYDLYVYANTRSIGAYEGNRSPTTISGIPSPGEVSAELYPNPLYDTGTLILRTATPVHVSVQIADMTGRFLNRVYDATVSGIQAVPLQLSGQLPAGRYVVVIQNGQSVKSIPLNVVR